MMRKLAPKLIRMLICSPFRIRKRFDSFRENFTRIIFFKRISNFYLVLCAQYLDIYLLGKKNEIILLYYAVHFQNCTRNRLNISNTLCATVFVEPCANGCFKNDSKTECGNVATTHRPEFIELSNNYTDNDGIDFRYCFKMSNNQANLHSLFKLDGYKTTFRKSSSTTIAEKTHLNSKVRKMCAKTETNFAKSHEIQSVLWK